MKVQRQNACDSKDHVCQAHITLLLHGVNGAFTALQTDAQTEL